MHGARGGAPEGERNGNYCHGARTKEVFEREGSSGGWARGDVWEDKIAPDEVDVSWSKDGDNITVRCADKICTHETIHDDDEPTLEFVSTHEDPVTVRLTNDERLRLERTDPDHLNGF